MLNPMLNPNSMLSSSNPNNPKTIYDTMNAYSPIYTHDNHFSVTYSERIIQRNLYRKYYSVTGKSPMPIYRPPGVLTLVCYFRGIPTSGEIPNAYL